MLGTSLSGPAVLLLLMATSTAVPVRSVHNRYAFQNDEQSNRQTDIVITGA